MSTYSLGRGGLGGPGGAGADGGAGAEGGGGGPTCNKFVFMRYM